MPPSKPSVSTRLHRALDFAIIAVLVAMFGFGLAGLARAQEPELIGGEAADAKDWPASVYASMSGASCSATVVGERVLLIAAHCVSNGGTARFTVGASQYTSRCTHAPGYRGNSTNDWALCLVDRKVEGVPYERVASDGDWCERGKKVRLTGYGCTRAGGSGGNDGVYRVGYAEVTTCPSLSGNSADVVTRGGAALCYGDSGGPAFVEYQDGSREVFGVNSRGDIATTSYLAATYHDKGKAFITTWADGQGVKICGVHADALGCRTGGEEPPPPPPPADCKREFAAYEQALSLPASKFQALKACLEQPSR